MKTAVACAAIALALAVVLILALGVARRPRANPRLALIDGNCADGRPLGDVSYYTTPLRAQENNMGYIRIRRDARWNSPDNIIGTVPCGTFLWGEGPLKEADEPDGTGYAVAVQDHQGHICRGYVSYAVVGKVAAR